MRHPLITSAAAALTLMLAACSGDAEIEQVDRGTDSASAPDASSPSGEGTPSGTIVAGETSLAEARDDDRFTTFLAAAEAAGLDEVLSRGTYTVFAPTEEAFGALPDGTLDTLLLPENREQLSAVLRYHVVRGARPASGLRGRNVLRTLSGETLDVTEVSGRFRVGGEGGGVVTQADLPAGDGVIHVLDAVLLPPPA